MSVLEGESETEGPERDDSAQASAYREAVLDSRGPDSDEVTPVDERTEPWPLMAKAQLLLRHPLAEPVQLAPAAPIGSAELVARIRRGDQWAEEAFYRRHVALVRSTVRR